MNETLVVNEIFFSLQGESTYAGLPCAFVRLTSCNLRCSYCDTEYAFHEGEPREVEDIVDEVLSFPTELVEITGGEPLLQPAVHSLIQTLLGQKKTVLIETGGAVNVQPVDKRAILIYDIKCPDSGMADKNLWANLDHLKSRDEIKFVISSRRDYEWSKLKMSEFGLADRHTVLFSPVWERVAPEDLAGWILADGLDVRMQLQLHKILWGADTRGV
jgi:7-carboxy-7-deazaguanine synthase